MQSSSTQPVDQTNLVSSITIAREAVATNSSVAPWTEVHPAPQNLDFNLNSHQMGQGASTPRSNDARNGSTSSERGGLGSSVGEQRRQQQQQQQQEQPAEGGVEERATAAARLRSRRRVRSHLEHLTRLGNRLMPTQDPEGSSSMRNRIPGLRFRNRIARTNGSRSPSPLTSPLSAGLAVDSRRRTMPSISRPVPLDLDLDSTANGGADMMDISPASTVTPQTRRSVDVTPSASQRRSRISRMRNSISSWPNLMSSELGSIISNAAGRRSGEPSRPAESLSRDMDIDTSITAGASALGTNTPAGTTPPSNAPSIPTSPSDSATGPRPARDRPSLFPPNLLDLDENPGRIRPGEDQAAMLSRLLSVAAAATAASLVGNAEQAFTEAQDVAGGHGGDGSFDAFLTALRNGRLEAALRNGGNEMGGGAPTEGQGDNGMLSLNFFRMFRFGSQPAPANEGSGENGEPQGRMVPVIIVGIRSVTPREPSEGQTGNTRHMPFFDALANLPVTVPGLGRRPRPGPHRRASSTGTANASTSTRDRDTASNRNSATESSLLGFNNPFQPRPAVSTDTPPGPHPPPSTPAEPAFPGSSSSSSQTNRRSVGDFSSANTVSEEDNGNNESTGVRRDSTARRLLPRRLSSPDPPSPFALPRGNASPSHEGGTARTGHRRSTNGGTEGTRSWIIYVLGGSYPENHPILTTPSLFTDEPTFEDMTLLSSLLGPAKPPVAAQSDVESAGGVFSFTGISDPAEFGPGNGERCQICLSEYEQEQQCRQLTKCKHVFHKECIDEWLTTGRNSCPLCRGQGVEEKSKAEENTTSPPSSESSELNRTVAAS